MKWRCLPILVEPVPTPICGMSKPATNLTLEFWFGIRGVIWWFIFRSGHDFWSHLSSSISSKCRLKSLVLWWKSFTLNPRVLLLLILFLAYESHLRWRCSSLRGFKIVDSKECTISRSSDKGGTGGRSSMVLIVTAKSSKKPKTLPVLRQSFSDGS